MVKEQLKILVQLAASDNQVAEKEAKLIYTIGMANGVAKEEIGEMLKTPGQAATLENLTDDQKFEYLYNVVQLMKVDGKVFKSEIVFCEDVAAKLGYKKGVVGALSTKIYSDPTITSDRDMVKKKAQSYLVK